jgi:hypothetical protein
MLLATGILMPRFLCKLKYGKYSVITSVRSVEKAYHTSDFSLTSYLPEAKKIANLKYKKGHNSGKNYRKIVIIELDLVTLRYTYIPHLASFTGYHTETTKLANLNSIEAQWTELVSFTCYSVLGKLYTEPSHQISINFAKCF